MTDEELKREARKQRALERLGTNEPICATCGECDWRCMERHHVADYGTDDATVLVCRNCHRKLSDGQREHPAFDPQADQMLHMIGRFLLGLADMLRVIVEKLCLFGAALIERAATANIGEVK